MPSRAKMFWIAAVLLLLVTGVDLVACELLSPGSCEIAGSADGQGGGQDDSCLCCCPHVMVALPLRFEPAEEAVMLDPPPALHTVSYETPEIYHPPQA